MKIYYFERLEVWKEAKDLGIIIFKVSDDFLKLNNTELRIKSEEHHSVSPQILQKGFQEKPMLIKQDLSTKRTLQV